MALKKTVVTPQGFEASGAYHRVSFVRLDGKTKIVFVVSSSKDQSSSSFEDRSFEAVYDLEGGNPIKQAYEHLKTTVQFSDAEDC
jgi:hypothetical protein